MQKTCITLIALLSLGLLFGQKTTAQETTKKYVLLEHFTNASCGPCADQNPAFDELYREHITNVHHISYHTDWPGIDPMNAANPSEVSSRTAYYGVTGVPSVLVVGETQTFPAGITENTFETVQEVSSSILLTAAETTDGTTRNVTVNMNAFGDLPAGDWRLFTAVVEHDVTYQSSPGSNGESFFPNVFRKMLPSTTGEIIESLNNGDNLAFEYTYDLDPSWVKDNVYVITFLQEFNSRAVANSGSSWDVPVELNPVTSTGTTATSNQLATFDNELTPFTEDLLYIEVTANAPSDWTASINLNGSDLGTTVTALPFTFAEVANLGIRVTPGDEVAIGEYTLSIKTANSPDKFAITQKYYVNNGITDLVVNHENDYGQIFMDALSEAGNSSFAAVDVDLFQGLINTDLAYSFTNIYYNVGNATPSLPERLVTGLIDFLENAENAANGANLMIVGQNVGFDNFDPSGTGTDLSESFYLNYMRSLYKGDGTTDLVEIFSAEDAFLNVPTTTLNQSATAVFSPDEIGNKSKATPLLYFFDDPMFNVLDKVAAIRTTEDLDYKVVYVSLDLPMIPDAQQQKDLIVATHDWFYTLVSDEIFDAQIANLQPLKATPNPSNVMTVLTLPSLNETTTLMVKDITGKVVYTTTIDNQTTTHNLETQALPNGTYFYQLQTTDRNEVKGMGKLVVTH
ncbi:MAG: Omp28-related outer membrane protein [Chitinophagales bacterium]